MRVNASILTLALVAAGCASPSPPSAGAPAPWSNAQDAFLTQRAVLTFRGRQVAMNGYLAMSRTHGHRLVVTESFGQVLADLLVQPDGQIVVMRSSRMLRPEWIRHYVASDLACLLGRQPAMGCAWQNPEPDRYVIRRRWYALDLRTVQTRPGPQPLELFDASRAPSP